MDKIEATQFKDQQPKLTWIICFMKRNKLSHKKAEMMSSATKLNTANPFIIYDFFNQLEVKDDSDRKLTICKCACTFFVLLMYASILFY